MKITDVLIVLLLIVVLLVGVREYVMPRVTAEVERMLVKAAEVK